MRRIGPVLLTVLIVAALPAPASEARGLARREVVEYRGPSTFVSTPYLQVGVEADCADAMTNCVQLETRRGERWMRLQIDDAAPGTTFIVVIQEGTDPAGFCGRDVKSIPIVGGSDVDVWLVPGTCYGTTDASIVTTGTLTATFSAR